jgi:hypothetical protein
LATTPWSQGLRRRQRLISRDASRLNAKRERQALDAASQSAHPEDAFIAELVASVASRCADGTERRFVRALATDLLDFNPELAYPWGTLDVEAWLLAPVQLSQQRHGVAPSRAGVLRRALLRWLARTGRIARRDARLMCLNVGALVTHDTSIAA